MTKNKLRKKAVEKRKKLISGQKRHEQNILLAAVRRAQQTEKEMLEYRAHMKNTLQEQISKEYEIE